MLLQETPADGFSLCLCLSPAFRETSAARRTDLCFWVAWFLSAASYFILMCLYKGNKRESITKLFFLSECQKQFLFEAEERRAGRGVTLIPAMNEGTRGRLGKAFIHPLIYPFMPYSFKQVQQLLRLLHHSSNLHIFKNSNLGRGFFFKAYHMVPTFKYILKNVAVEILPAVPWTASLHWHPEC